MPSSLIPIQCRGTSRCPDKIYNAVAAHFDDEEMVGLTVLVGTYNMHTRIFQALGIDLEK